MLARVDIQDGGNQSVHQEKTLESTETRTTYNDCKGGRVGFFPRNPSIQLSIQPHIQQAGSGVSI